jgi:hypothetical protein
MAEGGSQRRTLAVSLSSVLAGLASGAVNSAASSGAPSAGGRKRGRKEVEDKAGGGAGAGAGAGDDEGDAGAGRASKRGRRKSGGGADASHKSPGAVAMNVEEEGGEGAAHVTHSAGAGGAGPHGGSLTEAHPGTGRGGAGKPPRGPGRPRRPLPGAERRGRWIRLDGGYESDGAGSAGAVEDSAGAGAGAGAGGTDGDGEDHDAPAEESVAGETLPGAAAFTGPAHTVRRLGGATNLAPITRPTPHPNANPRHPRDGAQTDAHVAGAGAGADEGGEKEAPVDPCAVFVLNLSFTVCEPGPLLEVAQAFGQVRDCRVATKDGKSKGFGVVLYETPEAASACIAAKGLSIAGRELNCQPCRADLVQRWIVAPLPPKPKRPTIVTSATITSFRPRAVVKPKAAQAPPASSSSSGPAPGADADGDEAMA